MTVDNTLYDRLASTWWDENEVLNALRTLINPGRFGYFREVILERFKINPAGKETLDVGCGGGLLAEEFARLGCQVTGIDPSEPSIAVAKAHAAHEQLAIEYQTGVGENLPFADEAFDIVYCCDVLEHVNDLNAAITEISRVLKRDGIFFFDTLNRTFISNLVTIKLLQEWPITSVMPPHLHNWNMFVKPQELQGLLRRHALAPQEIVGLVPRTNPATVINLLLKRKRGEMTFSAVAAQMHMSRSKDTSNLYMGYAVKI